MTYVIPQVEVHQDFQIAVTTQAVPLQAHIAGPHAQLIRYDDADEKANGRLGFYDRLADTAYLWPNRAAGAQVDQDYTKLFVDNALLKYFEDTVGAGSTITKTAGYSNRIRSNTINFIEHTDTYPRAATLYDRDVKVGDIARVRFVPGGGDDPVTLWTYVNGFAGDAVAASIGSGSRDTDNAATHAGASATAVQSSPPVNAVKISAVSAAAYNPYPTGQVTEQYTVIVTEGSAGGDFTTARLRIISASGLDDVAEVTPAGEGSPTAIGTLGATATFNVDEADADASESADEQGISPRDLIAGQRWLVTVNASFTQTAAPTTSGTYTGTTSLTYIVTVVEGKKFAAGDPLIQVTTTTGLDISGPTPVTAAGVAVNIGTKGVRMTFAGVGLALGDRFYVTTTGAGEGPMRTIILGHNIPDEIADGVEADLHLFIKKPTLEVTENRVGFSPLVNFETSETEVTVNSGIIGYDESWTDDGVQLPMDLWSDEGQEYGELFVQYRGWQSTLCDEINSIDDVANLDDVISGTLHPDNPLKWAVFKALSNSNGVAVNFTAVCNPDDADSWAAVLELIGGRDETYGLVPLTRNRTVLDLWAAHADAQSDPENGLWRVAWFSLAGIPEIPIVHAGSTVAGHTEATTEDEGECLAVFEDDPDTSGSQYTRVRCPASNGNFITNGVLAGDIVRAQFTGDGFGGTTYSAYVIDAVQSEDQLRLVSGPDVSISVAAKIEIWRTLSATQEAQEIARDAGSWANRRIRAVWPDTVETDGTVQEGYFLCAALAGLRSGVLPQQGLTRVEVSGFTDVTRTIDKFNKAQLDIMAEAGTWIVSQSRQTGAIFTRHALTTGDYNDLNQREEMLTANVDSISFRFKEEYQPFIGVTNVTAGTIEQLRLATIGLIDTLKSEKFMVNLGGQLLDATIVSLREHETQRDAVVLVLEIDPPRPFNRMICHLVISA